MVSAVDLSFFFKQIGRYKMRVWLATYGFPRQGPGEKLSVTVAAPALRQW